MPWKKVSLMDERVSFVTHVLEKRHSVSDLCELYGISRKTGYKWVNRYKLEGTLGLVEKSRAPLSSPHHVDEAVEHIILDVKNQFPSWGAPKIFAYLTRNSLGLKIPSTTTIGRYLRLNNLALPKKKTSSLKFKSKCLTPAKEPNSVWAADFKGDFLSRCGTKNYPLTVTDLSSRYLLCCQSQYGTSLEETMSNFKLVFQEYGLPAVIRTDNGSQFFSPHGISKLSIWWIKLGIKPEQIARGRPQQNGCHERMHRTLKEDAIDPRKYDFHEQQLRFNKFKEVFNDVRPHEGINNNVPGELYNSSNKRYPKKIKAYDYPSHFELRTIKKMGAFSLNDKHWFVSHGLAYERIGLEQVDEGIWSLYFRQYKLGILDERKQRFIGKMML